MNYALVFSGWLSYRAQLDGNEPCLLVGALEIGITGEGDALPMWTEYELRAIARAGY